MSNNDKYSVCFNCCCPLPPCSLGEEGPQEGYKTVSNIYCANESEIWAELCRDSLSLFHMASTGTAQLEIGGATYKMTYS